MAASAAVNPSCSQERLIPNNHPISLKRFCWSSEIIYFHTGLNNDCLSICTVLGGGEHGYGPQRQELGHLEGFRIRAAAPPCQKPVQASDSDASPWKSPRHIKLGGDPRVDPELDGGIMHPIWYRNTLVSSRKTWKMFLVETEEVWKSGLSLLPPLPNLR